MSWRWWVLGACYYSINKRWNPFSPVGYSRKGALWDANFRGIPSLHRRLVKCRSRIIESVEVISDIKGNPSMLSMLGGIDPSLSGLATTNPHELIPACYRAVGSIRWHAGGLIWWSRCINLATLLNSKGLFRHSIGRRREKDINVKTLTDKE